jgi:arylsulfatase
MRNSPFRYYKQNQFEGGITTPAIVHWPAGLKTKPGAIIHDPAHIIDVLPTMVELCDAKVPATWPGRELNEISGVSLAPVFAGKSLAKREPIHFLFAADRALRDGDWKAVSFRSAPWELYNMKDDRTELNDLAKKHPERLSSMVKTWHKMTAEVLQAPERSQLPVATVATKHTNVEWTDFDRDPAAHPKRKGKKKNKHNKTK